MTDEERTQALIDFAISTEKEIYPCPVRETRAEKKHRMMRTVARRLSLFFAAALVPHDELVRYCAMYLEFSSAELAAERAVLKERRIGREPAPRHERKVR